jgi:hypothetical protein
MVDLKHPTSPSAINMEARSRSSSGNEKEGGFASSLSKSLNEASSLLKDLPTNVTKELKDMKELKDLQEEQEQEETVLLNKNLIP